MRYIIMSIWLFFTQISDGQQLVKGNVMEQIAPDQNKPLPYAQVKWLGSSIGTVTDETGGFSIPYDSEHPQLVILYVGFESDTILVKDPAVFLYITLKKGLTFDEVKVKRRRRSAAINSLSPKLTLDIGKQELQKAACCNLSESFETTPAVDVAFTDALTGMRQIRVLGLDGIYTQISREQMPGIRGFSSAYGMLFIPGSWLEGIQLTKGVGSVQQGFESMAGQINLELKKPEEGDTMFWDAYLNQSMRWEVNLGRRFDLKPGLKTGILAHFSGRPLSTDMNHDHFADNPNGTQLNLLNRWRYFNGKGWEGMAGVHGIYDRRTGGQLDFLKNGYDKDNFGMDVLNKGLEIWTKNGYVFDGRPYQSIGTQVSYKIHELESEYGHPDLQIEDSSGRPAFTEYQGKQQSIYANILFSSIFGNTAHNYVTGLSLQHDVYEESLLRQGNANRYDRTEYSGGAFFEYTFKPGDDFTLVAGMRGDYNNLYQWILTPRLHGRWTFNHDYSSLRFSGGRGQRTANIFAENQRIFASHRSIQIHQDNQLGAYGLSPEISWNYGVSLSHEFKKIKRPTVALVDLFRTDFRGIVLPDFDVDPRQVHFYHVRNGAVSHSFQFTLESEVHSQIDVRLSYRWYDVVQKQLNGTLEKAFLSPHRIFGNIAWRAPFGWGLDFTSQWLSSSRFPNTQNSPEVFRQASRTPSYMLFQAQISKSFGKKWLLYIGAENIGNFMQHHPIISSDNPFNPNFDSTLVWGPIFGRMFLGGVRYNLPASE